MHEIDIYEKFGEFAGIQEFDQCQGSFMAKKQGIEFTCNWLVEEGYARRQANTMISKAIRKYEK